MLSTETSFIFRVHQAAEGLAATPGCLEVDCWQSEDNQAVVSTGQWESEQAFMAGLAAAHAAGVDFDYDERECGLCDTHGFLVTAKNAAGNGATQARQRLCKHSLIEFSFALALPARHAV